RQKADREEEVLEPVALEELDDVLHARLADDRHHRLRLIRGERAQASALAARHDDCLHLLNSLRASRTYNIAAAIAAPRPIQKSQIGHCVASCVTIRQPTARYRTHVAALPRV